MYKLRKVRGEVSEESDTVKIMMRYIRSGAKLFWTDIRNVKWAVISVIALFCLLYILFGSICPAVCLTGIPCPACGLTRAGLAVLALHFAEAWDLQPFIYPILLWLGAAFVQRYLLRRRNLSGWLKWVGILLICGMLVFYAVSMYRYFPDREPYIYHSDNLLQKIVIYRQLW